MSKTAIVPVEPPVNMREAGAKSIPCDLAGPKWQPTTVLRAARNAYVTMLARRPPVPDELIEEAAKAMHKAVGSGVFWGELLPESHESYRNMARAAARVFNGGKDE